MIVFRPRIQLIIGFTIILIWGCLISMTFAEPPRPEPTIQIGDVTQGTLLFHTKQTEEFFPAPTLHTKVNIEITGLIVRGTVIQHFTNPSAQWVEGVYVFPLPESGAVDHLHMVIGKRRIKGMIQERDLAQKNYDVAKKQGRRASLLEQERPNMFTVSVANIGPGEKVSIEIEYQETLRFDQGRFHFRFPMVVGPRYIPGNPAPLTEFPQGVQGQGWALNTDQVPDASRITPPVFYPVQGLRNPVSLRINLVAGYPIARLTSRYHPIITTQKQEGVYTITLKDEEVPGDRDFEIIWEPQIGQIPQAAVFTETKYEEMYSLIMILPPTEDLVDQINQGREIIFVIDTSGSMYGTSIEQAKAAVTRALMGLSTKDRFNIIQFNTTTHALFSSSIAVSQNTIRQARRYVAGLIAEGGTEMLPALRKALQQDGHINWLRQVIFITDGQIGNETELFQLVHQQLGHSRLFTIGIGSAPNSYFMRKAAEFGGGTFTYIGKSTEIKERMDYFFQKLEHPAMSNIQIRNSSPNLIEQVPERVLDLYRGEPVMIAMKMAALPDKLTITGQVGQTPWKAILSLKITGEREGIAVYWARQKIESLMNQHLGNQPSDMIRRKIIDLALKHHLVSRYTSLVAIDVTPVRDLDQPLHTHSMKTNLPRGQDYAAIFGMAQGATPRKVHIIVGLVCLMFAYGIYRRVTQVT